MGITDNADLVLPRGSLILVTGASGYMASNFIVEALDAGYKVRGTARSPAKAEKTRKIFNSTDYDVVVVPEMRPLGAFDEAVKGVDAIVHMSSPLNFSPNPKEVVPPAVEGATSILRSAITEPQIKRFVFTSSSTSTSLPTPGVKFYIDKNTWNTEVDEFADFDPPYKPENAFKVYAASKTRAERAVWKFAQEERPHFVINCVCALLKREMKATLMFKQINPAVNMGRVIDSPGETGGLVIKAFNGDVQWEFLPQYMVNVVDCARLHLAALIDGSIKDERIMAFDVPFNWNVVLENFRELFPNKKFPDNQDQGSDVSEVDNKLGAELLRKWFQQPGWTGLKESLRQNVAGLG